MLAVNGYDESKTVVENFVNEKSLKQKMLLMGGKVARDKYAVRGYPTTFIVNPEGVLVDREVGFAESMAKGKEQKIEKLLAKSKAKADAE